jgi:nucleotide-binding universal stress UspA family protein
LAINIEAPVSKIFVALDPTRMVQPALEKAEGIAERGCAELHLYCCCYDSGLAFDEIAKQATVERTRLWLDRLAVPARSLGWRVAVDVAWNPEWRSAIASAAAASSVDLVVKTADRYTALARHFMKTVDWALMRDLSCPMLLVSPTTHAAKAPLLAAVKPEPRDEAEISESTRIMAVGHRLALLFGAELHAVTALESDERGPDLQDLAQDFAKEWRLPPSRVHVVDGPAHEAVAEIAERIGAGMLIIGCASESDGEPASIMGDTAQRVIDAFQSDIVVVPA